MVVVVVEEAFLVIDRKRRVVIAAARGRERGDWRRRWREFSLELHHDKYEK